MKKESQLLDMGDDASHDPKEGKRVNLTVREGLNEWKCKHGIHRLEENRQLRPRYDSAHPPTFSIPKCHSPEELSASNFAAHMLEYAVPAILVQ